MHKQVSSLLHEYPFILSPAVAIGLGVILEVQSLVTFYREIVL